MSIHLQHYQKKTFVTESLLVPPILLLNILKREGPSRRDQRSVWQGFHNNTTYLFFLWIILKIDEISFLNRRRECTASWVNSDGWQWTTRTFYLFVSKQTPSKRKKLLRFNRKRYSMIVQIKRIGQNHAPQYCNRSQICKMIVWHDCRSNLVGVPPILLYTTGNIVQNIIAI